MMEIHPPAFELSFKLAMLVSEGHWKDPALSTSVMDLQFMRLDQSEFARVDEKLEEVGRQVSNHFCVVRLKSAGRGGPPHVATATTRFTNSRENV